MSCRIIIFCVVVSWSHLVFAQGSSERLALQNIRKGKWEKAYAHLHDGNENDSVSVSNAYVLALYFFSPENPDFHLDSAYRYTQQALAGFSRTTLKQRDRLSRFPLDTAILIALRQNIDSAAFIRAKKSNTEKSYLEFGANFPQAAQQEAARILCHEAAYRSAQDKNSYEAYYSFLVHYPDAAQAPDARHLYERLLFRQKTADNRLNSFTDFIASYPGTGYQREAEQNIFEIMTAPGTIDCYKSFLSLYPLSHFSRRAQDILFHLIPEDHLRDQFPHTYFSDSLRAAMTLSHDYLVPFLHKDKFGFMNPRGEVMVQPGETDIRSEYRCGNISDDILLLTGKVAAINGTIISNGPVTGFEDIGYGFVLLGTDSCVRVFHKSGFVPGDSCLEDARVLNGKLLAMKKGNKWSLWSLSGRMLLPYIWDDISCINDVIVLKDDRKLTLQTTASLARLADRHEEGGQIVVDDVKAWRQDFVWVRRGNDEGVLDQSLQTVINIEKHVLSPAYFGSTAVASAGTQTFTDAGEGSVYFQQIVTQHPWTAVRNPIGWQLFDPKTKMNQSPVYDTITFAGPFAVGQKKDSLRVYFTPRDFLNLKSPARMEFVRGTDSTYFLELEQGKKKSLYTASGKKLFTIVCSRIQYGGEGFFIVHQKDKKGLISAAGKPLLAAEYDAIGTLNKGIVSLLQGTRFGLYDGVRHKLIKPQYTKNLTAYNNEVVIAYKDNLCGFLGWDNKPLSKVEFNEVQYWNDTTALVRKDAQWMLYEIGTGTILLDGITDFTMIRDGNDDKLAILNRDRLYGVIHNKKGMVIPLSFSDVINVGSSEHPLYFTEKHVEEASIFVVIYYDAGGKMLRKEIYEQDEYEKIYCSDN